MRPSLTGSGTGRADGVNVGGLARFSTVDWPGMMAATVFCQGCGWRCRFCHNPHLIPLRGASETATDDPALADADGWTWSGVLAWLRDRRGLLDGVVFSGGEPTLQPGLASAVAQTRELGFRVGLHTGGPVPVALAEVLPLLDWVGFDFKAPFESYARVTGRAAGRAAEASLRLVRAAGVACEVRTTWHPDLLGKAELGVMADQLVAAGVEEWVLQRFRPEGCADAELRQAVIGDLPLAALRREGLTVFVR